MIIRFCAFSFVAVSVALHAGAQETPKAGQEKVAFEKAAFPFEGEITCNRLNYRLSPKSEGSGVIAGVLSEGSKVVVIADQGDFFRILPPKGSHVWISARNVKKDSDTEGTVLVNDAPVRLDSRANAEKVVALNEGAHVSILKEHLGWMQIAPPDSVGYFVSRKYVKNVGPASVEMPKKTDTGTLKGATKGDEQAILLMKEADSLVDGQHKLISAQDLASVSFDQVVELFTSAAAAATTDDVRKTAEANARKYRDFASTVAMTLMRLREIADLKEQNRKKEASPRFEFTGYVDTVGPLWNRPGTHKLVMAGRIICFLKAKEGDDAMRIRMNQVYERYIGVKGTVIRDPEGWTGFSVVEVDSFETLTDTK